MAKMALLADWFRPSSLFGMRSPVDGLQYLTVGAILGILKYLVEATVIGLTTHAFYSPLDFVNPFLSGREKFLAQGPEWLGMAWLIWTFPFLVVCVLMSLRRCLDAGISPWCSLLTMIPILNLASMPFLAALPTNRLAPAETNFYAAPSVDPPAEDQRSATSDWEAGLIGLIGGVVYLVLTVAFCVYVAESYGTALFFGAPIVTTAGSSYWLNRRVRASLAKTIGHAILVLLIASLAFLLVGLEGGICIVMALPIFVPMAIVGALVGYSIASSTQPNQDRRPGMFGCVAIMPMLAFAEKLISDDLIIESLSSMEIQASIDDVWSKVIAFPDITTEPHGLLAWGIAYPVRAHIEGNGVGAVRYCEFTTGTFVEPITGWDAPNRLTFEVTDQPDPMSELSPYHSIHPPHLDRSFRSLRGEFRLAQLADGSTLLEASTWYRLEIGPRSYWRVWTDRIVHCIHLRVLEHLRRECEGMTPR